LKFIDENCHRPLTLSEIAEVTSYSVFHIHRIMSSYLHETLGSYIKRLRLEDAAKSLSYSKDQITDIAIRLGYEDLSTFSRAFKDYYEISPSEYRKESSEILKKAINEQFKKKEHKMEPKEKIVELTPKKVIYLHEKGDYNTKSEIAWIKLADLVEELEIPITDNCYGIVHDDPEITDPAKCRYDACIEILDHIKVKGELRIKEIFDGKFAMFEYKGPYEELGEFYNVIYGVWFPKSGYELRDIPTIEKYINDPATADPEELITEIFIPIH